MSIENSLAGIAVKDLEAAIAWYAKLFGRSHDTRPMKEVAEWRFPTGGQIQVFSDAERAGKSSVTLVIKDFAGEKARLEKAGFTLMNDTPGGKFHIAQVFDPDGNRLTLAEPMAS